MDRAINLARRENPEKTIEFVKANGRRIAFEIVDERHLEKLTPIEKQMLTSRAIELLIAIADFSTYLVKREREETRKLLHEWIYQGHTITNLHSFRHQT